MSTLRKIFLALFFQCILLPAWAESVNTSFQVSTMIEGECNINAANMAFTNYDPAAGAPNNQEAIVTVNCVSGEIYTVALNPGTTAGGALAQRLLTDGTTNTLMYNLYTDVGRTSIWGDGTSGTSTQGGTGTGIDTDFTVYGQIPALQNQPGGTYTDTITVTVDY